jgi:hypothetical protein
MRPGSWSGHSFHPVFWRGVRRPVGCFYIHVSAGSGPRAPGRCRRSNHHRSLLPPFCFHTPSRRECTVHSAPRCGTCSCSPSDPTIVHRVRVFVCAAAAAAAAACDATLMGDGWSRRPRRPRRPHRLRYATLRSRSAEPACLVAASPVPRCPYYVVYPAKRRGQRSSGAGDTVGNIPCSQRVPRSMPGGDAR